MPDFVFFDQSERVEVIASWLTERGLDPVEAAADAFHFWCAIAHEVEYLLTWNCAHIANPRTLPLIEQCLRREGVHLPTIGTPEDFLTWHHD